MTAKMRTTIQTSIILLGICSAMSPSAAMAEDAEKSGLDVTATLDAVSDYRFRGVSLSGRDPAIQPAIEISHSSGLHAGVWGSNIADNGGDDIELDLTGGYSFSALGFDADIGGVFYVYPGAGAANYGEVLASLSRDFGKATVGLQAGYVPAQDATGGQDSLYLGVTGSAPLTGPLSINGSFGRENGAFGDKKLDWSLGLDADLGKGFSAGLSYVDTHRAFAGNNGNGGVVLKLSKSF